MAHLGVDATARASFGVYNGPGDVEALVAESSGYEGYSGERGTQDRVEEVDGVAPPPKARVSDVFERKRDYLEGFLKAKPPEAQAEAPGGDLYEAVIEALKDIYDPEIPVNIYDLGLIYDVEITPEHHARSR
jgi:hypothetical protein